jgi:TIGR03009 family protein
LPPAAAPGAQTAAPRLPLPADPTLERRGPPGGAVPGTPTTAPAIPWPPFVLTPAQELQLERVLTAWERRGQEVKTFECNFTCFSYDHFVPGQVRRLRDEGLLKYAAPDKGFYKVEGKGSVERTDAAFDAAGWKKSANPRDEQWICDGKSIFVYNVKERRRIEYPLPPELQGKAIRDGPLPFVFGTDAQKLKQRYLMRIITPVDVQRAEVWLQAYPRSRADAANFRNVEVILKVNGLLPDAIRLTEPNGEDYKVYKFQDVVVNRRLNWLEPNWFRAPLPMGWRAELEPPQGSPQAGRLPPRR